MRNHLNEDQHREEQQRWKRRSSRKDEIEDSWKTRKRRALLCSLP